MKRLIFLFILIAGYSGTSPAFAAQCGGTERWFVKGGTDPDAGKVDLSKAIPITVEGLNNLPNLQGNVPHGDNKTRLGAETAVYQVKGRLVLFKNEDDSDYHLVITDDSLKYTPGGPGSDGLETGSSFIAEIPDANCVAGKKGDPSVPSHFDGQLKEVRKKFEEKFPNGERADTDLGGIPVTLTGILFYDRPHHQTGRAINGVELHPLLDISFGDNVTTPGGTTPTNTPAPEEGVVNQLFGNPGFEEGITSWSGTVEDIGNFENASAHRGNYFAWMGGIGTAHSESLYQNVTIPASAKTALLSFWIHIMTEETTTSKIHDKMSMQIRDQQGILLTTLKKYSNLDGNDHYVQESFDLSKYIGQDIQLFIKVVEDNGKATSFMLDDFALMVQ